MLRFLFFVALTLLSANSYALSADDYEHQERMESIITAFPWAILLFLAISKISHNHRYQAAIEIATLAIFTLSGLAYIGY
ncbi:TPA: hypothetical protein ACOL2D_004118 [Vibrio parahaemolyticus]